MQNILKIIRNILSTLGYLISRVIFLLRKGDFQELVRLTRLYVKDLRRPAVLPGTIPSQMGKHRAELLKILHKHQGKTVVVFRPIIDYNIPLFQRPQHIATELSRKGFLYFFCTTCFKYDHVDGFAELGDGLYLSNTYELIRVLLSEMKDRNVVEHLYSTDNFQDIFLFEDALGKGHVVVYEYIDEINAAISGLEIPDYVWVKHDFALANEKIICIGSADVLLDEIKEKRSTNFALVTNGADLRHFGVQRDPDRVPEAIAAVVEKGQPIIGYFGALASWFDYDLVMRLARERPDYQIVLIGPNYDQSLPEKELGRYPNIHLLGTINYKVLPQHGCWFDVATIPFKINSITESTSPIKLFEYMSMGLPVVTTALPECRKYAPVLVAENDEEYISAIDEALEKRGDAEYLALLRREAEANSWESKAEVIKQMIDASFASRQGSA